MKTHQPWRKEAGPRLQGSRALDSSKLQAPCIVSIPGGGFRLFYTAVGPAKPYSDCQGYILSAVSDDGLLFRTEPGIRVAPRPDVPHLSLRLIGATVTPCAGGRWRMYFEARGPADLPTVICSATSTDMLHWHHEAGIRLRGTGGVGGPRCLTLPDGRVRLYCIAAEAVPGGATKTACRSQSVVSAISADGLAFEFEPGYRLRDKQSEYDAVGITAAEVIPPLAAGDDWAMFFSAWQDVQPGATAPTHPSQDPNAVANGRSADFAAASIASDMSGYRSRIFVARSADGLCWDRPECVIEGAGYGGEGLDAVHAEDMSLVGIGPGMYRMYYAACDRDGNWRIASAVNGICTQP
jgi:hypothetical protein